MTNKEKQLMKQINSAEILLGMAEEEEDLKDALWFARRARRMEPNNLDAERMIAELSSEDNVQLMRRLEKLIPKGDQWLEENGYMDPMWFGRYWERPETKPYIRLRSAYCFALTHMGVYGKAATEAEEVMWLCSDTELGIEPELMHLYAMLGKDAQAEQLYKSCGDRFPEMLMPLSVLYYRIGDLRNARGCLEKMMEIDPDVRKLYDDYGHPERYPDEERADEEFAEEECAEEEPVEEGTVWEEAETTDTAEGAAEEEPVEEDSCFEEIWEEDTAPASYIASLLLNIALHPFLYLDIAEYFLWGYYVTESIARAEERKQKKAVS